MINRKGLAALIAIAVVAAVGNGVAVADFTGANHIVHISSETYFSSGGTVIACTSGCSSFIIGDVTGDPLWKVEEDVLHTAADTTVFSYNVTNLGYFVDGITSFHVPTNGFAPIGTTFPGGWIVVVGGGMVAWSNDPLVGPNGPIGPPPPVSSLNFMSVTYAGTLQPVIFAPGVMVDLDAGGGVPGAPFTMDDWVVSTIPLPGAWLLGAIGLAGVGWLRRRIA